MSPALPPVPAPWTWRSDGPVALLSEGPVPRLLVLWRAGTYEVSHADGTVIRDGVLPQRLPAVLSEIIPRLKLELRP